MTPETVFPIASMGKVFTSIALRQQHEGGRRDLQAPVTRYLPWFAAGSASEPITIHHLLTHTAGLICHYRAHNPWVPNFRVVLRQGRLILIHPAGDEESLVSLGAGRFRVGADRETPERSRFDQIVAGEALRATLSGGHYYRFFTP